MCEFWEAGEVSAIGGEHALLISLNLGRCGWHAGTAGAPKHRCVSYGRSAQPSNDVHGSDPCATWKNTIAALALALARTSGAYLPLSSLLVC